MARQPTPVEVQVTMADGTVMDFKSSLGDLIVMNEVNTYRATLPPEDVHYYVLQLTPCKSTRG